MAKKVGSIYAEIRAKLDKYERDLNQAHSFTRNAATKIQSQIDKIHFDKPSQSLQRFQRLLTVGIAGYGIKSIASNFIDTASSFEMMQTKLEALNGSRGKAIFEELNKMALDLPVSTEKLIQSFVTMNAMGLDPTRRSMLILADTAAVLGDDVFDRIVLQLGQMSAKGKVMSQDLNILAEAGINARQILKDAFGKTVEELQESNIAISDIISALFDGMEKKFGGSSQKIMNTWRGLTETARSYMVEIERIAAQAGIFDALKEQLKLINDYLKNWVETNKDVLKQDVPRYVDSIKKSVESIWNIVTYDKDILEYGLIGLLLGGKKGAVLAGGLSHIVKIPGMLGEASAYAAKGYINYSDVALSNYKELESLIEKGRLLQASQLKEITSQSAKSHGISSRGADLLGTREFSRVTKEELEGVAAMADRLGDQWNYKFYGMGEKTKKSAEDIEKEMKKLKQAYEEEFRGSWEYMWENDPLDKMRRDRFLDKGYSETLKEAALADYEKRAERAREISKFMDEQRENISKIQIEYEKTFNTLVQLTERTAEAMQDNFSTLFFDAITGELKSLEDYADAVFKSIARMVSDLAAQQLTMGLFGPEMQGGGWISGFLKFLGLGGSSNLSPMSQETALGLVRGYHSGGVVGFSGGFSRNVPASAFSFAPRLHNGLMADEYPAILQKGETVIPRNKSGMSNNITINVAAPNGVVSRESISQMSAALYASLQRSGRRNT